MKNFLSKINNIINNLPFNNLMAKIPVLNKISKFANYGFLVIVLIFFVSMCSGGDDSKSISEQKDEMNRSEKKIAKVPKEKCFELAEVPDLSLFEYSIDESGDGIVITKYIGKDIVHLKLPDYIEEIPVVKIDGLGTGVYNEDAHNEVKTIVIPDTVKEICKFSDWKSLENVKLSNSIEVLPLFAFLGCTNLSEVTIPDSVKTIGGYIFGYFDYSHKLDDAAPIKKLVIPDSVIEIDREAFSGCYYLEEIKLPKNIKEIPRSAFKGCISLKSIGIPDGVTEISNEAFYLCNSLKEINIPSSVKYIGDGAFVGCASLGELVIPEGVEILDDVFRIHDYFYENDLLKELKEKFGKETLDISIGLVNLKISDSVKEIRGSLASLSELKYLTLSNSLEELNEDLLHDTDDRLESNHNKTLTNLVSVNIPSSVKNIYSGAFKNLTSLSTLYIPDSLENIEFSETAFKGTTHLSLTTQKRLRELGYDGSF